MTLCLHSFQGRREPSDLRRGIIFGRVDCRQVSSSNSNVILARAKFHVFILSQFPLSLIFTRLKGYCFEVVSLSVWRSNSTGGVHLIQILWKNAKDFYKISLFSTIFSRSVFHYF